MSNNIFVWVEQFKGQAASVSWEAMGLARTLADGLGGQVVACVLGQGVGSLGNSGGGDVKGCEKRVLITGKFLRNPGRCAGGERGADSGSLQQGSQGNVGEAVQPLEPARHRDLPRRLGDPLVAGISPLSGRWHHLAPAARRGLGACLRDAVERADAATRLCPLRYRPRSGGRYPNGGERCGAPTSWRWSI